MNSAFSGVGLAAAIAARCGGWDVPVHCHNGAIVKFTCTNGAVASIAIWLKASRLVYTAKLARKNEVLCSLPTCPLHSYDNATVAVRIYLTIRGTPFGHYAVVAVAKTYPFDSSELQWRPKADIIIPAAVAITAGRVTNVITAVQIMGGHTWVAFAKSHFPTTIEFTPSEIRIGGTVVIAFTNNTTYNLNAYFPWRGQPDCAAYVARIATALVARFNVM